MQFNAERVFQRFLTGLYVLSFRDIASARVEDDNLLHNSGLRPSAVTNPATGICHPRTMVSQWALHSAVFVPSAKANHNRFGYMKAYRRGYLSDLPVEGRAVPSRRKLAFNGRNTPTFPITDATTGADPGAIKAT